MSSLSDLLPAGGGGKNVNFVASGVLPNGQPVVLKSNGQVEVVAESSGVGIQIPLGTSTQFNNANSQFIAISYNPNTAGQFIIAWKNYAAGNLVAVLGTVSGTTLTFGSITQIIAEVVVYNEIIFDPNTANRFVVVGTNEGSSNRGSAWVGTISGSSLSFSAEMFWNGGGTSVLGGAAFDPTDAGHFITTWYDGNNNNYGTLVTGFVQNATNINYYTEVVFNSAYTSTSDVAFAKSNEVFVVAYRGTGSASYGRIGVRTSNSATLYTAAAFSTSSCTEVRCAWDKKGSYWYDGKFIITYKDITNGDHRIVLGTVNSGNYSITFETSIVVTTRDMYLNIEFDPSTLGRFVVTYGKYVKVGTISGNNITLGTEIVYNSSGDTYSSQGYVVPAFDTAAEDGRFIIASRVTQEGKAVLSDLSGTVVTTNLTSTNFLGISDAAVASGASGSVTIKGGLKTELAGGTFAVTVANPGAGNRYYINGVLQQTLNLREGFTYKFDQSASSNSGHPFRFSTTSNGTHAGGSEYTTGVTTSGTPGNAGAYTQIVVAASAPTLYYYCTNHSLMGGQANTIAAIVANSIYYVQTDGSISTVSTSPAVRIGRAFSPTSINLEFS